MKGRFRVVITGASTYGVNNHGDDAMLATLVQGIQRAYTHAEITFLCRHPNKAFDQAFGFESIKNLDHDSKQGAHGRMFLGMNAGDSTSHLKKIAEAIQKADLLVIGGNSLMEIFPNGFLSGVSSYAVTLATLARFFETPYVLYGLNVVDSIKQQTTKDHARFLVENARLVTCREESCCEYLTALNINCSNVFVMGDPAYGIEMPIPFDKKITTRYKRILTLKPVVGAAFRYHYWADDNSKRRETGKKFANLLDRLIEALDCKIFMIPNCTYTKSHPWQDDLLVHQEICNLVQRKEAVVRVDDELSVFEAFDLFSLVDLHISNRRHSCIFAALHNKPFIAIEGLFPGHMQPFVTDLGLENDLCALDNASEIVEKARLLLERKSDDRSESRTRVSGLKDSARMQVDRIVSSG